MELMNNAKVAWTAFAIVTLLFVGYVYNSLKPETFDDNTLIETASIGNTDIQAEGAGVPSDPSKQLSNMAYLRATNSNTSTVTLDWVSVYPGAPVLLKNDSQSTTDYAVSPTAKITYGGSIMNFEKLSGLISSGEDAQIKTVVFHVTLAADLKTVIALDATNY